MHDVPSRESKDLLEIGWREHVRLANNRIGEPRGVPVSRSGKIRKITDPGTTSLQVMLARNLAISTMTD